MENTGKQNGLLEQFQSVQLNDRQLLTIRGGEDSNVPEPIPETHELPIPGTTPPK